MTLFGKLETEVETNAPASKFYEVFHIRLHLIPKVCPDKVQSCKLQNGEWGKVGSVVQWNYVHDGKAWMAKDLLEAIDEKNNLIVFKTIEGDKLEHYKNFKTIIQIISKDKGSVVRCTFEYEKLHDKISDNLPHIVMQFFVALCKGIDAHLMKMGSDKEPLVAA